MFGRFWIKKSGARTGLCNTGYVSISLTPLTLRSARAPTVPSTSTQMCKETLAVFIDHYEMSVPALFGSRISREVLPAGYIAMRVACCGGFS